MENTEQVQIIKVKEKPLRSRKSNWSEEEILQFFKVWSQPEILQGLRTGQGSLCKKQETFGRISDELNKLGVDRDYVEIKLKMKNLKSNYKKAKAEGIHRRLRFSNLLEKVLKLEQKVNESNYEEVEDNFQLHQEESCNSGEDTEPDGRQNMTVLSNETELTSCYQNHHQSQPVEIEFELMDLVKDQLPIGIEGGSYVIPQEFASDVGIMNSSHIVNETTSAPGTSGIKRKLNPQEIVQKRRKLQSLSEKMAETVGRVLTQTTDLLIEEMKKSEERFIKWEEQRRENERKQEEQMLKKLIEAIQSKPGNGIKTERQRMQETIRTSEDPCAATFDLLATNLMKSLSDQSNEIEDSLVEWETRMQRTESRHTDNLYKMILTAVNSSDSTIRVQSTF